MNHAPKDINDEEMLLNRLLQQCKELVGFRLLTLMKYNAQDNSASRIFSTDEKNYPIGGFKTIPDNNWTKLVIIEHESFIANNIDEIKEVFFDYQIISGLGLGSALNVPIISEGIVLGVVNLLDVKNAYSQKSVEQITKLTLGFKSLFERM